MFVLLRLMPRFVWLKLLAVILVLNVRIAALSTIFLMVNLLIALSFGVHREQFEQRIGLT